MLQVSQQSRWITSVASMQLKATRTTRHQFLSKPASNWSNLPISHLKTPSGYTHNPDNKELLQHADDGH